MTKFRVLVGALAVLWLVGFAVGCGLVSDQTKQEAKKKVEAKGICQVTNLFLPGGYFWGRTSENAVNSKFSRGY
jgi:hypothetical protein